MLNAGQHALGGPEHTGQLPADRVSVEDLAGHYTAVDAEAAFAEIFVDLNDHLVDTTDAHDASAISIVDAGGYYTSTDVEGALQEISATVAASGGTAYVPVMVDDPDIVTVTGDPVYIPLITAEFEAVMMERAV
jgi:hypothetical protein